MLLIKIYSQDKEIQQSSLVMLTLHQKGSAEAQMH
jgi:hypothetical protein